MKGLSSLVGVCRWTCLQTHQQRIKKALMALSAKASVKDQKCVDGHVWKSIGDGENLSSRSVQMQISEGSKVSKWTRKDHKCKWTISRNGPGKDHKCKWTISRNRPGKDHKCVDRHIWKHVNERSKVCIWTRLQTYQGRIKKTLMDVSGNASVKDQKCVNGHVWKCINEGVNLSSRSA